MVQPSEYRMWLRMRNDFFALSPGMLQRRAREKIEEIQRINRDPGGIQSNISSLGNSFRDVFLLNTLAEIYGKKGVNVEKLRLLPQIETIMRDELKILNELGKPHMFQAVQNKELPVFQIVEGSLRDAARRFKQSGRFDRRLVREDLDLMVNAAEILNGAGHKVEVNLSAYPAEFLVLNKKTKAFLAEFGKRKAALPEMEAKKPRNLKHDIHRK